MTSLPRGGNLYVPWHVDLFDSQWEIQKRARMFIDIHIYAAYLLSMKFAHTFPLLRCKEVASHTSTLVCTTAQQ